MPKRLSIIIPTYDRKETLKETILSFASQTSGDFEMIIADDGSSDGTGEMVKSLNVSFPLKHVWQKNSGRSSARNMGICAAEGEIILFIDDHIIVDKKLVEEHIGSHDKAAGTNVMVVRGRVCFIRSASEAPDTTEYIPAEKIRPSLDEQDPFRNFITNNISITKEALLSVGGFDEDFKEYGLQDSELGLRLKEAGCRFAKNPNAVGYIFGIGLEFEDRIKRRRQIGRASVLFYKKHPTLKVKLTLSVHFVAAFLYRTLSIFDRWINKLTEASMKVEPSGLKRKLILFYSFLSGMNEALERYKGVKRIKFSSRLKKPKVLFCSHNSRLEGAPLSLYFLAKNIDRETLTPVFVVPSRGPVCDLLGSANVKFWVLSGFPFTLTSQTRNIIEKEDIDLVHANTLAATWAIDAAKLAHVPVVWHVREDPSYFDRASIAKYAGKVDRVIAISKWVKSALGFSPGKVEVIYNAVEPPDLSGGSSEAIRKEFNIKKGDVLVGQIGSISRRKGTDVFLKACAQVLKKRDGVRFLIVGDYIPGERFKPTIDKLVKELRLEGKIIFAGTRKNIADVYAALDIVVSSSISEPFGRTLIEAMAAGKPVIGTSAGGIPEIIINEKTGIIVQPNDSKALADAIISLVNDEKKRKELALSGRKRAIEMFSIKDHVKKVEEIYEEVLR
jgi:glycosyltransferase involved in cell wall biosynthesis